MFLSARVNVGPHDERGVIGLARSTDLLSWEVLPPVSIPGDFTEMEVPQVVPLNGRYYLLFCATRHAAARLSPSKGRGWAGTHYLVADKLTGPYCTLTDEPLVADASGTYYAGKLVAGSMANSLSSRGGSGMKGATSAVAYRTPQKSMSCPMAVCKLIHSICGQLMPAEHKVVLERAASFPGRAGSC